MQHNSMKALVVGFCLFLFLGTVYSVHANHNVFHIPLGWVLDNNGNSVDMNDNGVIDNSENSERLQGMTPDELMPSGAVMAFNRNSCPTGWSRFSEASGRMVVGMNNGGNGLSSYNRLETGGEEDHRLTNAELPSHRHYMSGSTSSGGAHRHSYEKGAPGGNLGGGQNVPWFLRYVSGTTSRAGAHAHSFNTWTNYEGGGNAHNNMPPYVSLLYCEKN